MRISYTILGRRRTTLFEISDLEIFKSQTKQARNECKTDERENIRRWKATFSVKEMPDEEKVGRWTEDENRNVRNF